MHRIKTDICVIGGGSGGLSVAAGASQMGADTVLVEGGRMGGDCLNFGCVPSKALIAAAGRAQVFRSSAAFGITPVEPEIDYAAVMDHVANVIAAIEPHDSVERFEGLGVKVVQEYGAFISPTELQAGDTVIEARRFVVATGSSPSAPPIPGLAETPYLTNETIFEVREKPEKLIVIGAGPIGMELAQAHHRLGVDVTVLEAFKALGKDDPDLATVALSHLRAEGLEIREGVKIASISAAGGRPSVTFEDGEVLTGSHLLVAAGRKPNTDRLDLDKAGIEHDRRGVKVDAGLRTTNRRVYAIGDVAGGLQFTHVAGYHAGIVIRSALFRLPAKAETRHIPWVTYIDPPLAQVGLTEAQAREELGDKAEILTWSFADNDRAQAERETHGRMKVMLGSGKRIVGASIVGARADELIQPWALAIANRNKIGAMAGYVSPYPTLGEVTKRIAGSYYAPKLFSDRTRWIVRLLAKLG